MARVDFYVLQGTDERGRRLLACRLAEKAYRLDNTVYLHTASRADAVHMDELLWTFRDGSYVPHAMVGEPESGMAPITIGYDPEQCDARDVLINLGDEIPPFARDFPRVAEVVTADERCRRMSRKRFVEYRDGGHSIQTHKL